MTAAGSTLAEGQPSGGPAASRLAGMAGIVGGAVLLGAFAFDIAPELNAIRIMLFHLGAMAVAAGAYRPLAAAGPGLARVAVALVVITNAWGFVMVVISAAFSIPVGPGSFGVVYFWAGLAWWLSDGLFGFVALRLGGWVRLGAMALGVGSLLAITGMDRLELTTRADPTLFLPLSLAGIALNGLGWIVLGAWLLAGRRDGPAPATVA